MARLGVESIGSWTRYHELLVLRSGMSHDQSEYWYTVWSCMWSTSTFVIAVNGLTLLSFIVLPKQQSQLSLNVIHYNTCHNSPSIKPPFPFPIAPSLSTNTRTPIPNQNTSTAYTKLHQQYHTAGQTDKQNRQTDKASKASTIKMSYPIPWPMGDPPAKPQVPPRGDLMDR